MTKNIYLDLAILDSVTGGCHKPAQQAQSPLGHATPPGGMLPPTNLAPIAPTGGTGNTDPMQALAMLGLGVLDLVQNGEIDPQLIISGIQDALSGGLGGASGLGDSGVPASGDATDHVHGGAPGFGSLGGAVAQEIGDGHIGSASQAFQPDHVRDHRGEDSGTDHATEGHTTYNDVGTWHPLVK